MCTSPLGPGLHKKCYGSRALQWCSGPRRATWVRFSNESTQCILSFFKIFISFHQHWDNNAVRKCYKIKKTKRLKERHWLPAITSATTTRPCWASTFQSLFLLMSTKCQSDLLPIRKYKHKLIWHKLASMIFTITEREEAWCLTASLSCTHLKSKHPVICPGLNLMYHTPQRTRLVKKTQRENVYARVCVCACV